MRLAPLACAAAVLLALTSHAAAPPDAVASASRSDEAVRRAPTAPDTWLDRAAFLRDRGDCDGAQSDLDRALPLRAPDVHTLTFHAELDLCRGRYEDAVRDAGEALALDPGYVNAIRLRSTARIYAGDYDGAMGDLRRAHDEDPQPGDPRAFGAIQFMLGKYADSAATWAAATGDPTNASYYPLWRYLALRRAHPSVDASTILRQQSSTEWPRPVVDFYLGRIDSEALVAAAQASESRSPEHQLCEAEFYIGVADLDAGRLDEAFDLLRLAVTSCPQMSTERKLAHAELRRTGLLE